MVKVNPNDHMYHYRAVHQQMITDKMRQGENHNKYHLPTLGLKKKNIIKNGHILPTGQWYAPTAVRRHCTDWYEI